MTLTKSGSLWRSLLIPASAFVILAGCSSHPTQEQIQASRYHITQDRANKDIDVSHIPDAVPRAPEGDVKSAPYTLLGKTYTPRSTAAGYSEVGTASWYGKKFHGYKTANGEIYDMYGMSAAHKTLPLPSYVRVTNLANDRSVVVRVNDRGPFHGKRVIDLSWAAAKKLGYQGQGTARVRIEGIDTSPEGLLAFHRQSQKPVHSGTDADDLMYLQVAAFSTKDSANSLKQKILTEINIPVQIVSRVEDRLFRVRMGPFSSDQELLKTQDQLVQLNLGRGYRVQE
ncbi:septal ring lytic transglycosylase RlpA family protein [Sansalvadorimonas verongulae]|uniref:septal ring lytic transglycosylase RlpA family protein n=1 Tax=Sansalvadorimonas verongulae TaxID=2172824 RepID=UPI0012BD3D37|nr:septal ring lytic transglycosylase RlpA family protein [Sansalvadorimonas verongulae]MTI14714.1 septal ring lytic transglycosylase RlpA family protein [Sansalvadorimonas verongulae]